MFVGLSEKYLPAMDKSVRLRRTRGIGFTIPPKNLPALCAGEAADEKLKINQYGLTEHLLLEGFVKYRETLTKSMF